MLRPELTLAVYVAAIFLSAALLFAVQPMFAKLVLPRLGGSPSVWSVAMVFFQAALLAGYAYAHFLMRLVPARNAVIVHVIVMGVAALWLPLSIAAGWGRPPASGEAFWLLGLFAVSIGLPFFALAANAPLLQAWFARSGHPSAGDPYFLYAASNVGSFLALLSYPFVIEPFTRLGDQTRYWSVLFCLLIVVIAACGWILWRSRGRLPALPRSRGRDKAPSVRDALIWIALAAIPSGLLVAVTAHISTDVAAVPLLWVIPLALYLATFVIVFATPPLIPHPYAVIAQPVVIVILVGTWLLDFSVDITVLIAIHLAAFFVTALVCHGELARRRPPARYLTAFYLWMSAGGMIGGIAAGLIAPHIFNSIAEYPLLIILACLCRPGFEIPRDPRMRTVWIGAVVVGGALAIFGFGGGRPPSLPDYPPFNLLTEEQALVAIVIALLVVAVTFWRTPVKFAAAIALTFLLAQLYQYDPTRQSFRSFFGVFKIYESSAGLYRVLMHGTTIHGVERVRDDEGKPLAGRPVPLSYYHARSGIGRAVKAVRERKKAPIRMAVVGLGAGSSACLVEAREGLSFYEIDPLAVRIARNPRYFHYLQRCAPTADIVLGDARLTLADAANGQYDAIVVDAFSSDAIPIHLLTREAMAIYANKLAPRGVVIFHVSNRHLELVSVVAGIARANGFVARSLRADEEAGSEYMYATTTVAVARADADFGALAKAEDWELAEPDPGQWVWTDDYSNVIGAVLRQMQ
ncbi:MAG TPA: fused MFS/spermidine synthase [Xanthobacteraceae bacterium]|nr:fused MFS/spermidine synthase [Xanthobacteraceae bacterium]